MIKSAVTKSRKCYQTKFSFGASSALITNLGLIVGLDVGNNAKLNIIGGILVVALADNISDSFGIHIYQESEGNKRRGIWLSTFSNFLSRILVSFSFVFLIMFLPLDIAVIVSIIWGILLLTFLSYLISKNNKTNVFKAIFEHLSIALIVIVASHFVGRLILNKIKL